MSPYTLLQEELDKDPWKIFVCCIFCNLTKRKTSEPYFWKFLEKWPTPESAACLDEQELKELIQPLGLVDRRAKALKKMSSDYLVKSWKDDATKLYGIGKYGSDSYRLFYKNEIPDNIQDHELKRYVKEELLYENNHM